MFAQSLGLVLALMLLLALPLSAAEEHTSADKRYDADFQTYVPGANALEGRIRAPCCWNQTLDIHGSEISTELRREIRRRLQAGESQDVIQASFVERYGERILAVPPGSPLKGTAIALIATMAAAGVAGFLMVRRWRVRGGAEAARKVKAPSGAAGDERLEARLDAELRALDE